MTIEEIKREIALLEAENTERKQKVAEVNAELIKLKQDLVCLQKKLKSEKCDFCVQFCKRPWCPYFPEKK